MKITRVAKGTLRTKYPTMDLIGVITDQPILLNNNPLKAKEIIESMTNRKMDFFHMWSYQEKCIKALCKKYPELQKVLDASKKFFNKKTSLKEAQTWAESQIKMIGKKELEVPQIEKPIQTIV